MDNSKNTGGEVSQVTVGEIVDGEFFIQTDNDQLNAYLTCLPAVGGCEVTPEGVLKEARDTGINIDIDMQMTRYLISVIRQIYGLQLIKLNHSMSSGMR